MIKGKNLMIAILGEDGNYNTIAMATSCTFDASTTLSDALTKDDNEKTTNQEATGMSWSLKSENMIATPQVDVGENYASLFEKMINAGSVLVRFSLFAGADGKSVESSWVGAPNVTEQLIFSGTAIIESLELNATNKENATMSVSLKGKGRPTFGEETQGDVNEDFNNDFA